MDSNLFLDKYITKTISEIKKIYPNCNDNKIKEIIEKKYIPDINNPEITLENNYINSSMNTTLMEIYNLYLSKDNILTPFGCFFKNHDKKENLNAQFIDYLLDTRKKEKKLKFKAFQEKDKAGEKYHDNRQLVFKILNNSFYGVNGMSSSFFYSLFIAKSITYSGFALITTAIISFERFLANNYKYNNFDEILSYISNILDEYDENDNILQYLDDINIKNKDDLYSYIIERCCNFKFTEDQKNYIDRLLNNLNSAQLNLIYYKNNFIQFILNTKIKNLLEPIFSYEIFSASDAPDEVKKITKDVWEIVKKFVYYNHQIFYREDKVDDITRQIILGSDTDSVFVSVNTWFKFVKENFPNLIETKNQKYTLANTAIGFLNYFIEATLDNFTNGCKIPERIHPRLNMKSEFLFDRVIYTRNKKSYCSTVSLQEGNAIDPPKLDIKGISIKKSTVSKSIQNFFMELLQNDFFKEKLDIIEILKKLREFENHITESINSGSVEYTKPNKLNEIESYKFPYRMESVRGAILWNALFPDQEITIPNKVNTIKLKTKTLEDLNIIKDEFPNEYEIIKHSIFENENFENFGADVIAIPKNLETIPPVIRKLIDSETIVNDAMRNCNLLLYSLGLQLYSFNNKEYASNFLQI